MTLGERVKRHRDAHGWTQGELAKLARIDRTLLSRIEAGHTPNPGANTLKGLARVLGCSIDYLVGLYDDDHTDSSHAVATATP